MLAKNLNTFSPREREIWKVSFTDKNVFNGQKFNCIYSQIDLVKFAFLAVVSSIHKTYINTQSNTMGYTVYQTLSFITGHYSHLPPES